MKSRAVRKAPSTVRGFAGSRVREALGDLVVNAARYGTPGSRIEVRLTGEGPTVRLSVANEGEPMAAEPLRRGAVEPSEPASARTSLGLGLFIVHEIARAHGGEVSVVCEGGRTVFTLTLPSDVDGSRAAR